MSRREVEIVRDLVTEPLLVLIRNESFITNKSTKPFTLSFDLKFKMFVLGFLIKFETRVKDRRMSNVEYQPGHKIDVRRTIVEDIKKET